MSSDGDRERPTMSMAEAAELVGVSVDTVRRFIDDAEEAGRPVAERDRDERGHARAGSWRRPYRDAMTAWKLRRQGVAPDSRAQ